MATDESVITPLDHMTIIDRLLFPKPVDEISHHRGMVTPTRGRLLHLTVPPEKALPRPLSVSKRQTDRFRSSAANNESQSGCLVSELIKRPGGAF